MSYSPLNLIVIVRQNFIFSPQIIAAGWGGCFHHLIGRLSARRKEIILITLRYRLFSGLQINNFSKEQAFIACIIIWWISIWKLTGHEAFMILLNVFPRYKNVKWFTLIEQYATKNDTMVVVIGSITTIQYKTNKGSLTLANIISWASGSSQPWDSLLLQPPRSHKSSSRSTNSIVVLLILSLSLSRNQYRLQVDGFLSFFFVLQNKSVIKKNIKTSNKQ